MSVHHVLSLLLAVSAVLLLSRLLVALAVRLRQPPVIGELLAGILLGPTLVGGSVTGALFPGEVRAPLMVLAQLGVILFMFTVGLGTEHDGLRGKARVAAGTALGSTLVPFGLGLALGLYLLQSHQPARPVAFVVFIALAVSVTAFPVLARILDDQKVSGTTLGAIALVAVAIVDLAAWGALALLQAVTGDETGWGMLAIIPFGLVMVLFVPTALRRLLVPDGVPAPLTPGRLGVVVSGALGAAAATEAMGMHYIFGAFLFGAVVPRTVGVRIRGLITERIGRVTALLLPFFFVMSGLKVDLGTPGTGAIAEFGLIMFVAVAGKFGGAYLGARAQRLPSRPAAVLAVLMNTRGLTELIILGVGLEAGLLDGSLYGLFVMMALVTTAMTGPLLALIARSPEQTFSIPVQDLHGQPSGRHAGIGA